MVLLSFVYMTTLPLDAAACGIDDSHKGKRSVPA